MLTLSILFVTVSPHFLALATLSGGSLNANWDNANTSNDQGNDGNLRDMGPGGTVPGGSQNAFFGDGVGVGFPVPDASERGIAAMFGAMFTGKTSGVANVDAEKDAIDQFHSGADGGATKTDAKYYVEGNIAAGQVRSDQAAIDTAIQSEIETRRELTQTSYENYVELAELDGVLTDAEYDAMGRREDAHSIALQYTPAEAAALNAQTDLRWKVKGDIENIAVNAVGGFSDEEKMERAQTYLEFDAATNQWRWLTFTGRMVDQVGADIFIQRERGIEANSMVLATDIYLQNPDLSEAEISIANDIRDSSVSQRGHAAEAILLDGAVIMLGTASDIGLLGLGRPISWVGGKIGGGIRGLFGGPKPVPVPAPPAVPGSGGAQAGARTGGSEAGATAGGEVGSAGTQAGARTGGTEAGSAGTQAGARTGGTEAGSTAGSEAGSAGSAAGTEAAGTTQQFSTSTQQGMNKLSNEAYAAEQISSGLKTGATETQILGGNTVMLPGAGASVAPSAASTAALASAKELVAGLTKAEITNLFRPTATTILTGEQIAQKAALIRLGRTPSGYNVGPGTLGPARPGVPVNVPHNPAPAGAGAAAPVPVPPGNWSGAGTVGEGAASGSGAAIPVPSGNWSGAGTLGEGAASGTGGSLGSLGAGSSRPLGHTTQVLGNSGTQVIQGGLRTGAQTGSQAGSGVSGGTTIIEGLPVPAPLRAGAPSASQIANANRAHQSLQTIANEPMTLGASGVNTAASSTAARTAGTQGSSVIPGLSQIFSTGAQPTTGSSGGSAVDGQLIIQPAIISGNSTMSSGGVNPNSTSSNSGGTTIAPVQGTQLQRAGFGKLEQAFTEAGFINNQSTSQVPILGNIPLIGGNFKSQSTSPKSELIIQVTPHMIPSGD